MTFDLQRARLETPGTAHVLHFNNAGSALTSQPVLDASIAYLQREAQIGGYEAATEAHEALEHTSLAAAKLIGSAREEVALTDSADSAWNRAFYSIPFKPGDRVLTSKAEYHSNNISRVELREVLSCLF